MAKIIITLITPILVLCATVAHAADDATTTTEKPGGIKGFLKSLSDEITRDISDMKELSIEAAATVVSSQCSLMKTMSGMEYQQMEGVKEPDLGKLALDFIARNESLSVTFELSKAAQMIPSWQGFNPKQKLYIYFHGFTDTPTGPSFSTIREALFSRENCNVLALDGSSLISGSYNSTVQRLALYLSSTTYSRFISEKLGEVLAAMTQNGVDPAQIHLIGHSLGAQIASFAGKQFFNLTGKRVGRISGLDPAGPCFSFVEDELRLKHTDADFVDVIHTDAGTQGLRDPLGHVDYYPNAGSAQPNCDSTGCNHGRAWEYYAESVVNEEAFPAVKCDSWAAFKASKCSEEISYMGHPSKPGTRGLYFLQTRGESPFGLGLDGTKWKNHHQYGVIKNIANKITGIFERIKNDLKIVE